MWAFLSAPLPRPLFRSFLLLILFFGVADCATTALDYYATSGHEANPLAAYLLLHYGFLSLLIPKFFLLLLCYLFALLAVRLQDTHFVATTYTLAAGLFALISFSNFFGFLTGFDLLHFFLYLFLLFTFLPFVPALLILTLLAFSLFFLLLGLYTLFLPSRPPTSSPPA